MNRIATTAALAAAITVSASAGSPAGSPAKQAFERLKTLAGTWEAEKTGARVVYKVTGAGSALVETQLPDTPQEMVTVYHLDGDRLMLTHYCAAMNQPTMKLVPGKDPTTLQFAFVSGTNMKPTDLHIHNVKYRFIDKDHIVTEWGFFMKGKAGGAEKFDLHRVK